MRTITALLGAALLLAGCNTVQGLGQDVASVGNTVSDAAK